MATSKAQVKAVRKYESANYDKITLMLPKGTKDRIKASGNTLNGFITKVVLEQLEKDGN